MVGQKYHGRVYVAVMEGSAAETDGDSNWLAKVSSIIGVLVGLILFFKYGCIHN